MTGSFKLGNMATFALVFLVVGLLGFNQFQIMTVDASLGSVLKLQGGSGSGGGSKTLDSAKAELAALDVSGFGSTAQTLVGVFPELKTAETEDEILELLIPTGTPEYSEALGGITFDDPTTSLSFLAKIQKTWDADLKAADPAKYERYINMASKPMGLSCEFCCGVGAAGVTATGQSKNGCAHHPAILGIALGLLKETDYSDGEILREAMKWKTLFFPQKMITLALQSAGKDASEIEVLPQQVGGC